MVAIKRVILLAVLVSVFLAGYYAGRQPDSPDILAIASDGCDKAAKAAESFGQATKANPTVSRISQDLKARFAPRTAAQR